MGELCYEKSARVFLEFNNRIDDYSAAMLFMGK